MEELLSNQAAFDERLTAETAARAAAEEAATRAAAEEAARAMRRQSDVGERHAGPAVDGEVSWFERMVGAFRSDQRNPLH